jgi:hypothetical protein
MCKKGTISVTCDDDGNIVGQTDIREDGKVDRYDATDGDFANGHGHDVYSSMDAFLDSELDDFASMDSDEEYEHSGGDVYSRCPDDEDSKGRNWENRN